MLEPDARRPTLYRTQSVNDEPRRAIGFRVSYALLDEVLLQMPPGHKILRATSNIAGLDDVLIVVEGPDLPIHPPHAALVETGARYTKHEDGRITFDGWAFDPEGRGF